jgi:hypothetical protein
MTTVLRSIGVNSPRTNCSKRSRASADGARASRRRSATAFSTALRRRRPSETVIALGAAAVAIVFRHIVFEIHVSRCSWMLCRNGSRINGFDICVTSEVLFVERQNPADAVYSHCGHQSRVVHLNSGDTAHNQQFAPFLMYGQTVRQQSQLVFKKPRPTIGFLRRKPVPIAVKRTSTSVPEFSNVL